MSFLSFDAPSSFPQSWPHPQSLRKTHSDPETTMKQNHQGLQALQREEELCRHEYPLPPAAARLQPSSTSSLRTATGSAACFRYRTHSPGEAKPRKLASDQHCVQQMLRCGPVNGGPAWPPPKSQGHALLSLPCQLCLHRCKERAQPEALGGGLPTFTGASLLCSKATSNGCLLVTTVCTWSLFLSSFRFCLLHPSQHAPYLVPTKGWQYWRNM